MSTTLALLFIFSLQAFFAKHVLAANPGLEDGSWFRGTDLHFHISETSKAEGAAALAERIFGLPAHHLHPVYGYADNHHQAVVEHIVSPRSRYVVLPKYGNRWNFVLSPWLARQPGNLREERGVLFLQVWEGGEVTPLGYAVVRGGTPPGHQREFWDTLRLAASTTQAELRRSFNLQHIITPVIY